MCSLLHAYGIVDRYLACPTDKCAKKVREKDGMRDEYHCDSCNKDTNKPEPRYILNMLIGDYTGGCWVAHRLLHCMCCVCRAWY